jgi:hypothetical protein
MFWDVPFESVAVAVNCADSPAFAAASSPVTLTLETVGAGGLGVVGEPPPPPPQLIKPIAIVADTTIPKTRLLIGDASRASWCALSSHTFHVSGTTRT